MVQRLEKEVWELDNCTGCGLCVATCSKQVLHWNGSEHPQVRRSTKTLGYSRTPLDSCSFCQKFCEQSCPRLERWPALESRMALAARARGPIKSGTPNDVLRAITAAGRSAGLLDGVVMLDLDPWQLKPQAVVAETVEEIANRVGPQYLWAPVFAALNEAVFERGLQNLVFPFRPVSHRLGGRRKSRVLQDGLQLGQGNPDGPGGAGLQDRNQLGHRGAPRSNLVGERPALHAKGEPGFLQVF